MNALDSIRYSLGMSDMICSMYLQDLSDDDLLQRPVEGANHIAWQLGHLLVSQNQIVNGALPGSMPPLPEGFAEKFTKETASSDRKDDFPRKDELLSIYRQQHDALLKRAGELTPEEFERPVTGPIQRICKTAGEAIAFQPTHWTMHAGQWAVLRRKLGRPPLF